MKRIWIMLLWLAAAAASAQIQVQSARWEVIGGGPGCNAVRQMAEACDGRRLCQVRVEPRNLCDGDPAPGRLKSLNVGFSCYGQAQPIQAFRDGDQAMLRCESQPRGWQPSVEQHGRLQIYSARWEVLGGGDGCDATRQVVDACDGKSRCELFVDPRYLCQGDPAPGRAKSLEVRYACNGERQTPAAFADFAEMRLRCGHQGGNNPPPVIVAPPVNPNFNLHINSARWEEVDGGGWCDATPQMGLACDGKRFCEVKVDPRYVCGRDPAPGRNKSLLIGYSCNGYQQKPIAYPDFANATLRCDSRPANPPPTVYQSEFLQVQQARWEVLGGGNWCDATPQLAQACNGRQHCKIRVEPGNLCNGDPAPGQLKGLDIYFTCNGRPKGPVSFPDFADAVLRCERGDR